MAESKPVAILCTACGEESLLKRTPVYEGFKRTGEKLTCTGCGHVYANEAEVPFKTARKPAIFTEDDKPRAIHIFASSEKGRACHYCKHYVVNPFTQRCGLHNRPVEATDICDRFESKPAPG